MKTKIVYVLTCSESNYYGEQFLISVDSLKYHTPESHVTLLTDNITREYIEKNLPIIFKYTDEVIEKEYPTNIGAKERSRSLKTQMRKFVSGDFLFIDTDTVITDDLSDIDNELTTLGLVLDSHKRTTKTLGKKYNHLIDKLEIRSLVPNECQIFNSGVILAKDEPIVHDFFNEWHNIWLSSKEMGIYYDQPALFCTNLKWNLIKEINPIWHCQVQGYAAKYIADAKIIHYFTSVKFGAVGGGLYLFMNDNFVKTIKEEKHIREDIQHIIHNGRSAFNDRVLMISGNALNFYVSPLCRLLHHTSLRFPCVYTFVNSFMAKFINLTK